MLYVAGMIFISIVAAAIVGFVAGWLVRGWMVPSIDTAGSPGSDDAPPEVPPEAPAGG